MTKRIALELLRAAERIHCLDKMAPRDRFN